MAGVDADGNINQIRCGNRFNKDKPCTKSMCLAQFPGNCRGCNEPIEVNDILVDSDWREDPVFGVYNSTQPQTFSLEDPARPPAKKVWGHLDCSQKFLLPHIYKCMCCKELIKHFEKKHEAEIYGNFGRVMKGWRHVSCPSITNARPLKRNIKDLLPDNKIITEVEKMPKFQAKVAQVTQVDGPSILNMPFQETKEYIDALEVQAHLANNETPPLTRSRASDSEFGDDESD